MIDTRNIILQHYVKEFAAGAGLPSEELEPFFDSLLNETDVQLLVEALTSWEKKGITEDELFGLATLMRSRMTCIHPKTETVVDIVGTGGSRAKTFNVSTAAALVVAGAGIPVAKHGNRAATSSSGSSDVLAMLGVNADASPERAERCLNDIGICFMFAPRFHSLSKPLAEARRMLGRPTIFNNLGPLCNPAGATHQLIGVWSRDRVDPTAVVLSRLGTTKSWVVHGANGLDEITLGETIVTEIELDRLERFTIGPADFGLEPLKDGLTDSMSPLDSSRLIGDILENKKMGEPAEDLVLVNSAAVIYITGKTSNLREGLKLAKESIRSGKALSKLNALKEATTI